MKSSIFIIILAVLTVLIFEASYIMLIYNKNTKQISVNSEECSRYSDLIEMYSMYNEADIDADYQLMKNKMYSYGNVFPSGYVPTKNMQDIAKHFESKNILNMNIEEVDLETENSSSPNTTIEISDDVTINKKAYDISWTGLYSDALDIISELELSKQLFNITSVSITSSENASVDYKLRYQENIIDLVDVKITVETYLSTGILDDDINIDFVHSTNDNVFRKEEKINTTFKIGIIDNQVVFYGPDMEEQPFSSNVTLELSDNKYRVKDDKGQVIEIECTVTNPILTVEKISGENTINLKLLNNTHQMILLDIDADIYSDLTIKDKDNNVLDFIKKDEFNNIKLNSIF